MDGHSSFFILCSFRDVYKCYGYLLRYVSHDRQKIIFHQIYLTRLLSRNAQTSTSTSTQNESDRNRDVTSKTNMKRSTHTECAKCKSTSKANGKGVSIKLIIYTNTILNLTFQHAPCSAMMYWFITSISQVTVSVSTMYLWFVFLLSLSVADKRCLLMFYASAGFFFTLFLALLLPKYWKRRTAIFPAAFLIT